MHHLVPINKQAAAFCTKWSFQRDFEGRPIWNSLPYILPEVWIQVERSDEKMQGVLLQATLSWKKAFFAIRFMFFSSSNAGSGITLMLMTESTKVHSIPSKVFPSRESHPKHNVHQDLRLSNQHYLCLVRVQFQLVCCQPVNHSSQAVVLDLYRIPQKIGQRGIKEALSVY